MSDHYADPTEAQRQDPRFDLIWEEIKDWDINVPTQYDGYTTATGNHVAAIMDALDAVQVVLDPEDYRTALVISADKAIHDVDYSLVADADLVVDEDGMILKNRTGHGNVRGGAAAVKVAMELPSPEPRDG